MDRLAREEEAATMSALVRAERGAIDQILAEALEDLRAKNGAGFGYSTSASWVVGFAAKKRIDQHLREARLRLPST